MDPKSEPSRKTNWTAILLTAVVIVAVIVLYFAISGPATTPEKFPGGQNPTTQAPQRTETPESTKPPGKRDSG
jgi:hypothetical protein